jgi:hypothetical protein
MSAPTTALLAQRFLFRFSLPVRHVAGLPHSKSGRLDLPEDCRLPDLGGLEGVTPLADVRVAWNEGGLGVSARVEGKRHPPDCDPDQPGESDGLSVWIDTRNTQSIHRAGRFCHWFVFLPAGGGKRGDQPVARQLRIPQARDEAPLADAGKLLVSCERDATGYRLEAWLPGDVLHGFDPEASPRLGFYYCVRDAELGEQFLTVGREFPFTHDPSLWTTLELAPGT